MRILLLAGFVLFSSVAFGQTPQQNAIAIEQNSDLIKILMWGISIMGAAIGGLALYIKSLHQKGIKAATAFTEAMQDAHSTNEKISTSFISANEKLSTALDKNTSAIFDLHKLILERIK